MRQPLTVAMTVWWMLWRPDVARAALAELCDSTTLAVKCASMLLWNASALPMVGSPVGANQLALQRFEGMAATTQDEWADGLTAANNESATGRERRAWAGVVAVSEHFTFGAWADEWRRVVGLGRESG